MKRPKHCPACGHPPHRLPCAARVNALRRLVRRLIGMEPECGCAYWDARWPTTLEEQIALARGTGNPPRSRIRFGEPAEKGPTP